MKELDVFTHTHTPVSYTHLDVYKRQHSVLGETHSLQSVEKIQTSKYFLAYFGFLRVKQSVPRKKTSALAVVKSEPFERKTQF